jgi:hypothetical protein
VPGSGIPVLNFPEISMWGQSPWGGYGATAIPDRLQAEWNGTREQTEGGFPYSEGIYEDLNKVICAQFYWTPDRSAMEMVKEYIAFEFSPEVVDDAVSIVRIFEKNHMRDKMDESAVTAYQLMKRVDARLTPQARCSWRWRLFCIRATIDQEMYMNSQGKAKAEVFQQACDELTKMYHVSESTQPFLRPTQVPVRVNAGNGNVVSRSYRGLAAASR